MKKIRTTLICGVIACALAAGTLAGCSGKIDGTKPAITVNGEVITMGEAIFALRYQQAMTMGMMAQVGLASTDQYWDLAYSESEEGESVTHGENFKETTMEEFEKSVLLSQHMEDYGLTFPEPLKEKISEVAEVTYKVNAEQMDKLGITQEDIASVLTYQTYQVFMYDSVVADVDTEVSDEEAKQCSVSYARYNIMTDTDIDKQEKDADPSFETPEEGNEAHLNNLQEFLDQVLASDDPASADFEAIGEEIDSKMLTLTFGFGADDDTFPQEVKDAVATLKDGEVYGEIVKTDEHYYVLRLDREFDEERTESKKKEIINERKQEYFNEIANGWLEDAEITTEKKWDEIKVSDKELFITNA